MVMTIDSRDQSPCSDASSRRLPRGALWSRLLGIALLPLLLIQPVKIYAATVSDSYGAVLNWNGSNDPEVAGYRIYYGTNSGNYFTNQLTGMVTSYAIIGLTAGVTYYFAVATVGTDGSESPLSVEVSFVPGLTTVEFASVPSQPGSLIMGGLAGNHYEIQATEDLKNWATIGRVTMGVNGATHYSDTNALLFSKRFYRTHAVP